MRRSGTFKFYDITRGFGFIRSEGVLKDIFVHATAIPDVRARPPLPGEPATFELQENAKGLSAVAVERMPQDEGGDAA